MWEKIGGQLDVVSCGESGVWGVNHEDEPWYRTGTYGGVARLGSYWISYRVIIVLFLVWVQAGNK